MGFAGAAALLLLLLLLFDDEADDEEEEEDDEDEAVFLSDMRCWVGSKENTRTRDAEFGNFLFRNGSRYIDSLNT